LSDGRAQSLKGIIATVSSTASVPLVVRGTAGQSANLSEWQNSGSTVLARVDKNGAVSAQYFGPSATGLLGYVDWTTSSPLFQTGGTAVVGIRVRGAASQTADLQQWQNSSGGTVAKVDSVGDVTGRVLRSTLAARIVTSDTTVAPMVITTAAGQTSNNTEWQSSSGTVAYITASGVVNTTQYFDVQQSNGGIAQQGTYRIRFGNSSVGIGATSPPASGATGIVLFITNLTAAPVNNPTGGGYLYVEAGALKYRGSSGTITTIANA